MKRISRFLLFFVSGVLLLALAGWAVSTFLAASDEQTDVAEAGGSTAPAQVWTCSMHPQIRMDHKDICPLCGMDLVPVAANQDPWEAESPATRLVLGEKGRQMARVATTEVRPRALAKELRTVGRVEFDETRVAYITARIDGRVDQVYADFPGTPVRQGEHLVKIYSPQLFSTQQEFLTALRNEKSARGGLRLELSAASRRRLALWGITEQQIDELTRSGKPQEHLVVYSPMGGTVIEKNIRAGQYVKEGDSLYTIADLSRVWLVLEIYESELAWVRVGLPVEVAIESEPHRPLTGTVAFVEPVLANESRTVRVRVIVDNMHGRLKPGMYAQALLHVPLLANGEAAPTGLEGKYVCPMHPYEVSDKPGNCPQCKMPLELVPGTSQGGVTLASQSTAADAAARTQFEVLAVPAEAVLTTGTRRLVYVEREPGKYELVEPKLGPRAGDYYPVLDGLKSGDRVVARGNFLLDSQYQITGRVSLLYPGGSTGEHAPPDATTGFTPKEQANLDKLAPADREMAVKQKICPITGARLGSMGKPVKLDVNGRTLFLCCKGCEGAVKADAAAALKKLESTDAVKPTAAAEETVTADGFTAEELAAIAELPAAEQALAKRQKICPATEMNLGSMGKPYKLVLEGRTIFLCCEGCVEAVKADPEAAFKKLPPAVGAAPAQPSPHAHGGSRG